MSCQNLNSYYRTETIAPMGWEYRLFMPLDDDTPDIGIQGRGNSRTDVYYAVSRRVGLKMRSECSLEYKTLKAESTELPGLSQWSKGFEPPETVLDEDEMVAYRRDRKISCAKSRVQTAATGLVIEQTDIVLTGDVAKGWPKRWRSWCCEGPRWVDHD